jgi:hypothetical protein
VKEEIIIPAAADGVVLSIKMKSNIRKLWTACRKNMKTSGETKDDAEGKPLGEAQAYDILEQWKTAHGFVIPDAWLLIPTIVGKLWRDVNAPSPKIEVMLVESLRPLSCYDKSTGNMLTAAPGKAVEAMSVIVDTVARPMELYVRVRAWFVTMAYVSIRTPSFFDLQAAFFASDKILQFVTQTYNKGQVAPLSFYTAAWAATMHFFSEQVRVAGATLKKLVMDTGAWEFRWTNWSAPQNAASSNNNNSSGGEARTTAPDLPAEVIDEMKRLKALCAKWQGVADKNEHDAEKYRSQKSGFGGGKRKGDAKGGAKGG